MIKTLTNLLKQDKEKFVVPKGVQDCIPITAIYDDGIFRVGKDKYSKSFKFTDINFAVASREDKEAMFLEYSELLNSLDSGECGRPFAEPYGKNYACKQCVFDYAQSGVNRQN